MRDQGGKSPLLLAALGELSQCQVPPEHKIPTAGRKPASTSKAYLASSAGLVCFKSQARQPKVRGKGHSLCFLHQEPTTFRSDPSQSARGSRRGKHGVRQGVQMAVPFASDLNPNLTLKGVDHPAKLHPVPLLLVTVAHLP